MSKQTKQKQRPLKTRGQGFEPRRSPEGISVAEPIFESLSSELKRKLAESKLAQIPDEEIITALFFNGADIDVATQAVQSVASHPFYQASDRFVQLLRKLQSHLEIQHKLRTLSPQYGSIDRRSNLSRDEFLEHYYAANRPVILTDLMGNWQALSKWTPDYLQTHYGEVSIEAQAGRSQDPRYEVNLNTHRTQMLMKEYIDRILQGGETNDLYMVANNGNLDRPELSSLLNDVEIFSEYLDPRNFSKQIFFWFGPAGTITPLHHDQMNIFFSQVYGRKRVKLISPDQTPWVYNYQSVHSEVDCENPDYDRYPLFRNVTTVEAIIEPGEVLFIPVGWWHHVRSLEVSISVSFTNFLFPNHFDWDLPTITL